MAEAGLKTFDTPFGELLISWSPLKWGRCSVGVKTPFGYSRGNLYHDVPSNENDLKGKKEGFWSPYSLDVLYLSLSGFFSFLLFKVLLTHANSNFDV